MSSSPRLIALSHRCRTHSHASRGAEAGIERNRRRGREGSPDHVRRTGRASSRAPCVCHGSRRWHRRWKDSWVLCDSWFRDLRFFGPRSARRTRIGSRKDAKTQRGDGSLLHLVLASLRLERSGREHFIRHPLWTNHRSLPSPRADDATQALLPISACKSGHGNHPPLCSPLNPCTGSRMVCPSHRERAHPYENVHARQNLSQHALPKVLRKIPSLRSPMAPTLTLQRLPMSSPKAWLRNAVSLAAVIWMCVGCTRKIPSLRELEAGPSFSATVQKVQVVRMKQDRDTVIFIITIKPAKGSSLKFGITTVDPQLIGRAESLVVGKQYVFPDALTK